MGDFQRALGHFQSARRQGKETPALIHNLAVTHYKLQQYDEAGRLFRELLVLNEEWPELAAYNLGLIALRQGDERQAERWFRSVRRTGRNEKLVYLAGEGLARLGVYAEPANTQAVKSWFSLLNLGGGYDDNAIAFPGQLLVNSSQGSDTFVEMLAFGQASLAGDAEAGLRLQGFAFMKQYNDLDIVDVSTFNAAVIRDRAAGDLELEYGVGAGHTELNGESLTSQVQGRFQISLSRGGHEYTGTFLPVYYLTGSKYSYLEGWRHRYDLRWRHRRDSFRWTARYRLELNDRADLATEDTFLSYSPLRSGLLLETDWYLSPGMALTAGAEYEISRYGAHNRLVDLDGKFKETERASHELGIWLKGQYQFRPNWRLLAEYRYSDNDDSFILYQYQRNEVKIAVEFTY